MRLYKAYKCGCTTAIKSTEDINGGCTAAMESITYHRGSSETALKNGTKGSHTSAVVEGTALVWHIQTRLFINNRVCKLN